METLSSPERQHVVDINHQSRHELKRAKWFRISVGVLLLAAAGLKLEQFRLDSLEGDSILSSPRMQMAIIEVEALLGFFLLLGRAIGITWISATCFFLFGAALNLYVAISGQSSCGCLGRLSVNPWLTFLLDVVLVLGFFIWFPRKLGLHISSLTGAFQVLLGTAVFMGLIAAVFLFAFDDPERKLALLRGEEITVEPAETYVGEGKNGEYRTFSVGLRNNSDRSVQVFGGTTTCSCITTEGLPIRISPREERAIPIHMKFRGIPGHFQHRFLFYTDGDKQAIAVGRVSGDLTQSASP